jgi:histidinol dehydrogenase
MREQIRVRVWKANSLPPDWFKRGKTGSVALERRVKKVINRVKQGGDDGLRDLTNKFDKVTLDAKNLKVTPNEIKSAYKEVTAAQVASLKMMKNRIEALEKQILQKQTITTTRDGITIQAILRPLESVGCYVPGGQAVYPSTLVMTVTPAKVAGVPRIVVCSPPTSQGTINPLILVAADICEVDEVYKVGGGQSIAALAYGTETIKPVKKIVGPGSEFVTLTKILVSKDLAIGVAIDMPAGPSEILVLADETANPRLIALDMISQAEHGADSVAGLITTSEKLAKEVQYWLVKTAVSVERGKIVRNALEKYGFIIICDEMKEAIELANVFAPEHLEIMTQNPDKIAEKITSAGLILVGSYSPVALSDYASGTNHVLPTGGFGHAFSGLSALDFTRRVSIVESSKEGLRMVRDRVKVMTEAENLPNHYKAVEARFEK